MPLLAPVAAACVEAVKAEAAILPPSVPAKAVVPTVLRAAANAANAAVPAPAPAAAGTAEARTAVDVVPPSPVTAEVEVEAAVHPPPRKSQPRKSSEPRRTRLMQHQDLTGATAL